VRVVAAHHEPVAGLSAAAVRGVVHQDLSGADTDWEFTAGVRGGRGGTTALGLPYPDPADPVANTATAIQALAEAVTADLMPVVFASAVGDVNTDAAGRVSWTFPALGTVLGVQFTGRYRVDQATSSGFGGIWVWIEDGVPGRVIAEYRSTAGTPGTAKMGLNVLAWGNAP
jgi:hypothetical protein